MAQDLVQFLGVGCPSEVLTRRRSSSDVISPTVLEVSRGGFAGRFHGSFSVPAGNANAVPFVGTTTPQSPRRGSFSLPAGNANTVPFGGTATPQSPRRGSFSVPAGNANAVSFVATATQSPRLSASRPSLAANRTLLPIGTSGLPVPASVLSGSLGNSAVTISPRLSASSNPRLSVSSNAQFSVSSNPRLSVSSSSSLPWPTIVTTPNVLKIDPRTHISSQQRHHPGNLMAVSRTSQICKPDAVKIAAEGSPVGRARSPRISVRDFKALINAQSRAEGAERFLADIRRSREASLSRSAQAHETSLPQELSTDAEDHLVERSLEQEQADSPTSVRSAWAMACLKKPKKEWVPAITTPTYFFRHDERRKLFGLSSAESLPSSACSTPRSRRGKKCYQDLYADAAERRKRLEKRKEALEADAETELQSSRESSLRATRRYKSSDTRTVLQRTDDLLRKRAELQELAEQEKKKKEEQELEECTFKPQLSYHRRRSRSPSRQKDEREIELHLRQLAHKQLDVKARLVKLESEWLKVHINRKKDFADRCKAVQNERKQEVFEMLRSKEGQEYYLDRVQRLVESSSTSNIDAQSAVLYELLEQQHQLIQEQVGEELDKELLIPGRDLEFWTRRNVLLESLEAIEARASPTLEILSQLPEARDVIKASSFYEGLARHLRENPPDPDRDAAIMQDDEEKVSAALRNQPEKMGEAVGTTQEQPPVAIIATASDLKPSQETVANLDSKATVSAKSSQASFQSAAIRARTLSTQIVGTSTVQISPRSRFGTEPWTLSLSNDPPSPHTQKVIVSHAVMLTPVPSPRVARLASTPSPRDAAKPSELIHCGTNSK